MFMDATRPDRKPHQGRGSREPFSYIRVSTDEQARHGVSLDAQEERLRAYCTMRGLDRRGHLPRRGLLAPSSPGKGPGGARLLRLIAKREAVHVVALTRPNLSGNAADALAKTEDLEPPRRRVAFGGRRRSRDGHR